MPLARRHHEPVPVEHRWFGLDTRTVPLGLVVLAVFVLATVVVPRVERAVAWDDAVQAGEQLALGEDVVFTPTAGWNVQNGFRLEGDGAGRSGPATVIDRGVTFHAEVAEFDGTAAELLDQVEKVTSTVSDPTFTVEGEATSVTTSDGEVGVVQSYSSVRGDGLVATFVIDGVGIEVTAYGPPQQMATVADEVRAMVLSIRTTKDGDDA